VSSLLHVAAFVLCVIGTRTTVKVVSRAVDDTTLIYLPRLGPPAVTRPAPVHAGGGGGGGGEGGGMVLSANPPPRGFQVVDAVSSIPSGIPSIDPNQKVLDPRDFTGRGVEGGLGWGVVGGTGSADQVMPEAGLNNALYAAELHDARFVPADLIVRPHFVYPRVLLSAGVGGRVTMQFIVDTLGLVEPTSIKILTSTHEAFSTAAREGIVEARFTPASYGEHAVRQLTRMPVSFVLETDAEKS
jgi:TonB family protein